MMKAQLMDPTTVRKLEGKIEEAIVDVIVGMGLKKPPLLPSGHTFQMMAKAAVAVYGAAWRITQKNEQLMVAGHARTTP